MASKQGLRRKEVDYSGVWKLKGPPQVLAKRAKPTKEFRIPTPTRRSAPLYGSTPPGRRPARPLLPNPDPSPSRRRPSASRGHGRRQEEVGGLGGGGRHLRRPHARHARHPAGRGLPRLRRPAHPLPRYCTLYPPPPSSVPQFARPPSAP